MEKAISATALNRRAYWISEIKNLSGHFSNDSEKLEKVLTNEIKKEGSLALIDHLRLCGSIPEEFGHDSTEEKLYSKYTDIILSLSFNNLGLNSIVLTERSDSADVEVFANNYSFVADAKAFRLSRTAKNPKDFKVQAMDGWKRGKPYAMVVCPIYQLPNNVSQIYQQAITRNVCIFSYSHLAILLMCNKAIGKIATINLLGKIFQTIATLNPTKNACDYWLVINRVMLETNIKIQGFWNFEKKAALESVSIAKEEGLSFLAQERERIIRMKRNEAIKELIKMTKIDNKIKIIRSVADNGLLEIK